MKKLRVLVGCEESQAVCIEFRKLGHEAYSCDTQECSGCHTEWHLQMDIFEAIELMKSGGVLICLFASQHAHFYLGPEQHILIL